MCVGLDLTFSVAFIFDVLTGIVTFAFLGVAEGVGYVSSS